MRLLTQIVLLLVTVLAGCSKKEIQHVTVTLKNGETFSGTLENKDENAVTVLGANGVSRTLLTRQIVSMDIQKALILDQERSATQLPVIPDQQNGPPGLEDALELEPGARNLRRSAR